MSTWQFDASVEDRKRVLAIQMCSALAMEAENPETPLSALADKALAIAELLMDVDMEPAFTQPRLTPFDGGRVGHSGRTASLRPKLGVIEGSRK